MTGTKTTNINSTAVADEVLVNRNGSTGVQKTSDLAVQLAATGAIAEAMAGLSDKVEELNQGSTALVFATWAALASVLGSAKGQRAEVRQDAGTHTDPVVGGTVSNKGVYSWSLAPQGWQRVSNLSDETVASEVVAARADYSLLGGRLNNHESRLPVERPDGSVLVSQDDRGFSALAHTSAGLMVPGGTVTEAPNFGFVVMDERGFIGAYMTDTFTAGFGSGDDEQVASSIEVTHMVTGAVTHNSATIKCDIEGDGTAMATAVISTDPYGTDVAAEIGAVLPLTTEALIGTYRTATFNARGVLQPASQYYARIYAGGVPHKGDPISFRTHPAPHVAAPFSIVFGSCSRMTVLPTTIRTMKSIAREANVLAFWHLGDIDYSNLMTPDLRASRASNVRRYLSNPDCAAPALKFAMDYISDDHDNGAGNNNHYDTEIIGTTADAIWKAGRKAARESFPFYPAAQFQQGERDPDKIIHTHWYDIGKIRFCWIDTRSQRRYLSDTPTTLGIGSNPPGSWDQLGWLTGTFLPDAEDAYQAGQIQRVVFVVGTAWPGTGETAYGWGEFWAAERTVFCDAMASQTTMPLTIFNGDSHWSGAGYGSNIDFSTGGVLGSRLTCFMSSPFLSNGLSGGGDMLWLGASTKTLGDEMYMRADFDINGDIQVTLKGNTFTGDDANTLWTVDTADL